MSRKPLSSTKTRWAPRRAAFFYPWPVALFPPRDGGLVPLHGAALGLLATPAQCGQDLPDMAGVVANPEPMVDQLGDPSERPDIGPIPSVQRALHQSLHECPPLRFGQSRRSSRRGPGPESPLSRPPVGLPPSKHRTHRRFDLPGHRGQRPASFQELNGTSTALLQLLGTARWSHVP
jgi:hypothetical protein